MRAQIKLKLWWDNKKASRGIRNIFRSKGNPPSLPAKDIHAALQNLTDTNVAVRYATALARELPELHAVYKAATARPFPAQT